MIAVGGGTDWVRNFNRKTEVFQDEVWYELDDFPYVQDSELFPSRKQTLRHKP